MNSATTQHPLHDTPEGLSFRFCCVAPPSPRHHAFYFDLARFPFLFFRYGGGGRGRISPKGETDGIQMRTRFCQTIFWGYGFGKTETEFSARRKGSGE